MGLLCSSLDVKEVPVTHQVSSSQSGVGPPHSKAWPSPRGIILRHNNVWRLGVLWLDTAFAPREARAVSAYGEYPAPQVESAARFLTGGRTRAARPTDSERLRGSVPRSARPAPGGAAERAEAARGTGRPT